MFATGGGVLAKLVQQNLALRATAPPNPPQP